MHCKNCQQTICDSLFNQSQLGVMMTPKYIAYLMNYCLLSHKGFFISYSASL